VKIAFEEVLYLKFILKKSTCKSICDNFVRCENQVNNLKMTTTIIDSCKTQKDILEDLAVYKKI
jgi:hypothetical protein